MDAQDLDLIALLFQQNSITDKTMKNKDSQWRIFTSFCQTYREQAVPVQPDTLVRYAVYLMVQRRCSVPTVSPPPLHNPEDPPTVLQCHHPRPFPVHSSPLNFERWSQVSWPKCPSEVSSHSGNAHSPYTHPPPEQPLQVFVQPSLLWATSPRQHCAWFYWQVLPNQTPDMEKNQFLPRRNYSWSLGY